MLRGTAGNPAARGIGVNREAFSGKYRDAVHVSGNRVAVR